MNCSEIINSLGFDCAPRPNAGLRVFSPFTFGDGTGIGVYVEPLSDDSALVTDHGDAFMHLSSHGVAITHRRLRWAQQRCSGVEVSDGGVIQAVARISQLGDAIASVLDAALLIGHQQQDWTPSVARERFVKQVAAEIERVAPQRLLHSPKVVGFSGHQLEFPLGVELSDSGIVYIQTVAAVNDELDWSTVYRTAGKMTDIREAGIASDRRVVVIDDRSAIDDIPRAMTLLGTSATVLEFSHRGSWIERFAA
ncbi:DUF1828 domain-containing protein [Quisquiliibacterium transsilvanicum]|uniref:DUF1828 domain-containing protein n=1 Tax=Quisquiliibacterium transsilvanicum TaxID=1549638 RepID=A0A7W8HGE1_9BURK|nr:DUF1828 domain-containing protein [Quisquiliibacterium transsilvanicum]MBB5271357.1 hypothetical protein [Quisquiliibacterium transsilvanicum]